MHDDYRQHQLEIEPGRPVARRISPSWLRQLTRPPRVDSDAVLDGVNALRFASTVRSARPAGVDPACAPHESATARWATSIAIDSSRAEAYVQNISLVPHGTPSTSSGVERFGMTLESIVPTAS